MWPNYISNMIPKLIKATAPVLDEFFQKLLFATNFYVKTPFNMLLIRKSNIKIRLTELAQVADTRDP